MLPDGTPLLSVVPSMPITVTLKTTGRYQLFKRQYQKMVKHTQTIRRQIADEWFDCAWSFCGIGT